MRLLLFTLLVTSCASARPEATDTSSTNKISTSKSTSNSIQATAQKSSSQQSQTPYNTQFLLQKSPGSQQNAQPLAPMYILAQPAALAVHGPSFQQAVHQLLNYYNTNPQAKYQLLQQQNPNFVQPAAYQQQSFPQNSFPGAYPQIPQHVQLPSGALHVIPSPQLSGLGQLAPAHIQGNVQYALAVPAPGHIGLPAGLVAQIPQGLPAAHFPAHAGIPAQLQLQSVGAQQLGGAQALLGHGLSGQAVFAHSFPSVPTQLVPAQTSGNQGSSSQSSSSHGTPISTTLSTSGSSSSLSASHALPQAQALTQSHPSQSSINHQHQTSNQITAQQIASQLPTHYSTSAQLAQYQPQTSFSNSLPIGNIAPHGQFGLKSNIASQIFATNDYLGQTEKSTQSSSSNYNPVYRATYIKG